MSLLRTTVLRSPRTLLSVRTLTTLNPNLYTASSNSSGSRASGASSTKEVGPARHSVRHELTCYWVRTGQRRSPDGTPEGGTSASWALPDER